MERDRYNLKRAAYGAVTNGGFFGRDAVETAARVEPLHAAPARHDVREVDRVPRMTGESGAWYLTPLAAFGAAAALAFGMFAGGNLLLNYDDRLSAFWNGDNDRPVIAERAFAGAVATLRPTPPRPTRKLKNAETMPVEHEADIEVISEALPAELPDEFFEDGPDRDAEQHEMTRSGREKRFKELEKIRNRQQKNLKDFLETTSDLEAN